MWQFCTAGSQVPSTWCSICQAAVTDKLPVVWWWSTCRVGGDQDYPFQNENDYLLWLQNVVAETGFNFSPNMLLKEMNEVCHFEYNNFRKHFLVWMHSGESHLLGAEVPASQERSYDPSHQLCVLFIVSRQDPKCLIVPLQCTGSHGP